MRGSLRGATSTGAQELTDLHAPSRMTNSQASRQSAVSEGTFYKSRIMTLNPWGSGLRRHG